MMTFTYVAAISGICAWSLPGGASSMFQRMSVSTPCLLLSVWHLMLLTGRYRLLQAAVVDVPALLACSMRAVHVNN
jgi:hypothetical protein